MDRGFYSGAGDEARQRLEDPLRAKEPLELERFFHHQGARSFASPARILACGGGVVSPADLDADGRTDLVVANRFAETVTVLLNLDLEDGPTEIPSDLAPLLNGPESTSRAVHDRSLFDLASEGDKMISDLGRKRRFPVCDAENPS